MYRQCALSMFSAGRLLRGAGLRKHGATALAMAIAAAFVLQPAEAEEAPSEVGVAMAATLLGSISFIMLLYYFINYPDKDIQEKSWETVSSTISIFCAVLLFQSFNDMTEAYIIDPIFGPGDATMGALYVDIIHMLLWFTIMQLALALLSGAAGPWAVDSDEFDAMNEAEQEELKEAKEVNMKCYAVLLAHITGFASINAFGTVQAIFFASSPARSFLAVPLSFVCMLILQRITDTIRERISMGDDGEKDEFEELWDEETEEAENDVFGLTLSFTMINAMRFLISGCLPNQEGKEEECPIEEFTFHHTFYQKALTIGTGFASTALICVIRVNWPEWCEEEGLEKIEDEAVRSRAELFARTYEGITVAIAMCFSWSFFYGVQMILAGYNNIFEGQDELLSVVLALVMSCICLFGLIPLDWLADQDWTDDNCDRALRSIMEAMALLIGFAWEQCFDTSVDAIAAVTKNSGNRAINPHTTKLGLSIFCAGLLVPAWKMYILPFMVAKGWRYGYVLKLDDLQRVAKKMILKDQDEDEHEGEVCQQKFEKAIHLFLGVHEHGKEKTGIDHGLGGPDLGGSAAAYVALAGDDEEALRTKNAALCEELSKAKIASVKAQQLLDRTMESMLSSMKHMNQTCQRIEKTA